MNADLLIKLVLEEADPAPHGVLIHKDKVFVGLEHGKPAEIHDPNLLSHVKSIGDRHGYSFEGAGESSLDTHQPTFGLKHSHDYRDGWDVDRSKSIAKNGIKPHNMSVLFSNVEENWGEGVGKHFQGDGSVFDGIHRFANNTKAFGGAKVEHSHVEEFLKHASEGTGRDLVKEAKSTPAAKGKEFLGSIEKVAWPDNWSSKKRTTGPEKMVDQESAERNDHVLKNMGPGVYFAGSGHLKQIADSLKSRGEDFTMHGGSKISV